MIMCPLCNGIETVTIPCPKCNTNMDDRGKATDYFDDYSAYMDIDLMKMVDGDPNSHRNQYCLHYFVCPNCYYEETKGIKE